MTIGTGATTYRAGHGSRTNKRDRAGQGREKIIFEIFYSEGWEK